ncbi:hypothetical protein A9Q99_23810 [Gammaproteobacteria bacterium 45_16_T64]|nr:hypothetical protein A9Q99_23810 [Gammaproteobacteria bacterium 45_16_T64]
MPDIENPDSLLLPVNYMRHLLDIVDSRGGSRTKVMENCGISAELLNDPEGQFSYQQFSALILASVEESQEPALGLYLGSQLTVMTHGNLSHAILSSADVEQGMGLAIRYFETRTPLAALTLETRPDELIITFSERYVLGAIRISYLETVVTGLVAVISFITNRQLSLNKVELAFSAPAYESMFEPILGCPVVFDAEETRLHYPAMGLDTPLAMADKNVHMHATQRCEEEMASIGKSVSIEKRIEQNLLRFQGGYPSFEHMAGELSMSPRTLRRRLLERGTSFNAILDRLKYQLAVQHLETSALSIQEIGYLLGYSDPSNFGRAFKKWSGVSPIAHRENMNKNK